MRIIKKLFKKEKQVKRQITYRVRIAWINDTPWYNNLTMKEIRKFENNPDVLDVMILG